ncbi:MAG: hypothetical protein H8E41_03345 [Desulfobulbaceae bacterium]|uniref:Phosphohydrolase n=1 Tax=Candidatus Desulfobia pelagia TaxID=2841692 RepID=A0A8J6NDK7_9BACT|nr:hypothetical protein [Candidatus Desulfobia pelagia]
MTTPTHCPGFESFKNLKSFICKCSSCGAEKEIFSDEFKLKHKCVKCHQPIDFQSCEYYAGGDDETLR